MSSVGEGSDCKNTLARIIVKGICMEKSNACLRGPSLLRQINKNVSPMMIPITEDKKIAKKMEFSKYNGSHFKYT
ncbi:MAG: Uncharacterised protein [Flavobacteriaceae bacterium]|nr:MAG: Uncharacterised protein [Flavobacteriaceae bacterium]